MKPIVYVVHCIDTEGPLYESLDATFMRIESIWGLNLEPSNENLRRLRDREIDLDGREDAVAELVASPLLDYNDSWDKLNAMLGHIASSGFNRVFGIVLARRIASSF